MNSVIGPWVFGLGMHVCEDKISLISMEFEYGVSFGSLVLNGAILE